MELIMDTLNYFVRRQDLILDRTWEHFVLVLISMGIAIAQELNIGEGWLYHLNCRSGGGRSRLPLHIYLTISLEKVMRWRCWLKR